MAATKQELVMQLGPPDHTTSDGAKGEVLIWSQSMYNSFTGNRAYKNRLFYLNENGRVYHWLVKQGPIPPDQLDVRIR